MRNDLSRAKNWISFILERCDFPDREALAAQFANADITEFCECGCNSFSLTIAAPWVPKIATAGTGYGLVYEANFRALGKLEELKSLDILLFANDAGYLRHVEIDFCANALPVPETLELEATPYHVFRSETLRRARTE